jgi:hypothetical protein
MGNQLRLVAAFDAVDKRISGTIVYSVIAVIGLHRLQHLGLHGHKRLTRLDPVTRGISIIRRYVPVRLLVLLLAGCGERATVIAGTWSSTTACTGYDVYNSAYIHLLSTGALLAVLRLISEVLRHNGCRMPTGMPL